MIDQSIHPRARLGGDKKNTCAPRAARNGGQGGKYLRRAMKNLQRRVKDWQATKETLEPEDLNAYIRPGSMKP